MLVVKSERAALGLNDAADCIRWRGLAALRLWRPNQRMEPSPLPLAPSAQMFSSLPRSCYTLFGPPGW